MNRYTLMNSTTGAIEVKTLNKDQEQDTAQFKDAESSADLEVQEKTALLEWLANSYKSKGCQLEFVTNRRASSQVTHAGRLAFARLLEKITLLEWPAASRARAASWSMSPTGAEAFSQEESTGRLV